MEQLHQKLTDQVKTWEQEEFPCLGYPALAEILEWARDEAGRLRFLRRPQLRALEIYWYLLGKEVLVTQAVK